MQQPDGGPALTRPDREILIEREALCEVSGIGADVAAIDVLARLQLALLRRGRRMWLGHASTELRELLALLGLDDVLPCADGSVVETRRQPEEREHPRGVEEEGDGADPVA